MDKKQTEKEASALGQALRLLAGMAGIPFGIAQAHFKQKEKAKRKEKDRPWEALRNSRQ